SSNFLIIKSKKMKTFRAGLFVSWLPVALAVCMVYGIMYLVVQQHMRMSADDVPMQYATYVKEKLQACTPVQDAVSVLPQQDIATSRWPFVMAFNDSGHLEYSTATLHGSA